MRTAWRAARRGACTLRWRECMPACSARQGTAVAWAGARGGPAPASLGDAVDASSPTSAASSTASASPVPDPACAPVAPSGGLSRSAPSPAPPAPAPASAAAGGGAAGSLTAAAIAPPTAMSAATVGRLRKKKRVVRRMRSSESTPAYSAEPRAQVSKSSAQAGAARPDPLSGAEPAGPRASSRVTVRVGADRRPAGTAACHRASLAQRSSSAGKLPCHKHISNNGQILPHGERPSAVPLHRRPQLTQVRLQR